VPTRQRPEPSPEAGDASPATEPPGRRTRAPWRPVDLPAIRPRRLYEQIAEKVEVYIRDAGFQPGDRLPPERELAQQLGVSRPSVREAMIALDVAGVVDVRVGSGTYVRARPASLPLPRITPQDMGPGIREQFYARKIIEPALAELAAETITPDELAALHAEVDAAEEKFLRDEPADQHDYAFHVKLAEASRHSMLAALVRSLWDMRKAPMWETLRERINIRREHRIMVIADRRDILRALEGRNGRAARVALARLLQRAERRYFR
jgi:DNA-binding FadR family transcriptional regulator